MTAATASTPLLDVRACTIRFGGLTAVSALDLQIHPDQLIGLIGPNGAGKTTVFNLITGVYQATEGSVTFAGRNLDGLKVNEIVELGIARTTFSTTMRSEDGQSSCWNKRASHSIALLDASRRNPFERRFRDIHTLMAHGQAQMSNFESAGEALFGSEPRNRQRAPARRSLVQSRAIAFEARARIPQEE